MQYSRKCTKSQRKKGEFSEKKNQKCHTVTNCHTRARKLQMKLSNNSQPPPRGIISTPTKIHLRASPSSPWVLRYNTML